MARRHRHDLERSYVGFRLGDVHYAVPVAVVKEIVVPSQLSPLPQLSASLMGVTEHRGEVVPVVDTRVEFGLRSSANPSGQKWVLVVAGKRSVALAVDRVTDVFGTDSALLPPPVSVERGHGVLGVVAYGEELVFVLDTGQFTRVIESMAPPALLERGA